MSDQLDDNFVDPFEEEVMLPVDPEQEPKKPGNRSFLTAVGIIGAITLLVVIVGVVLLLFLRNGKTLDDAAEINAQNTMTVQAATQQAYENSLLLTPSATILAMAEENTPTPVIVFPSDTPVAESTALSGPDTEDPRTATVAALLTQAALGDPTQAAAGTLTAQPGALPTTGFADEVGLPGLFGLALLAVIIIFVARKLRTAS